MKNELLSDNLYIKIHNMTNYLAQINIFSSWFNYLTTKIKIKIFETDKNQQEL